MSARSPPRARWIPAVSSFFSSSRTVRPPRLGQMIQRRGYTDRPAPNDHHPRLTQIPPSSASPFRASLSAAFAPVLSIRLRTGLLIDKPDQTDSSFPKYSTGEPVDSPLVQETTGLGGVTPPGPTHRRSQMQIDLLDTFLDLAETRSFHRTAERLRITQSTVSARVSALEQAVGPTPLRPLPRRDTTLTPEGKRFEPHARALRHEWNEATAPDSDPAGCRCNSCASASRTTLPPSTLATGWPSSAPAFPRNGVLHRARLFQPDVRRHPDRHSGFRRHVRAKAAP